MKKYTFLVFIALLFLFCVLNGFQKQQKLPQEKHEVEVRLVLVDVIVTKSGEFVTDLTKEDFDLYEDEKKVPINSFELFSFAENKVVTIEEKPEEETPPEAPSKKLVVLVDGVNSFSRHLKRGAKKVVNELTSLVKLGHEVMIIHMSGKKGVEILHPFTTQEETIRGSIEQATGSIWVDKSLDALMMAQEVEIESTGGQAQVERKLDKAAVEENLSIEYGLSKSRRFELTAGGILAAVNMIKDLPGRKSILFISDGIPSVSRENFKAIKVFDPFNILKRKKFINSDEVIQEVIRYANAQNISIYTLDLGMFTEYFFTASAESFPGTTMLKKQEKLDQVQNLRWISEDTGAVWLRGATKYGRFRKIMKTDLNYYYQLSYYPPRKGPDNKYHKIKVKVNRSDVNVRCRKGYTDYTEKEEENIRLVSAFYNPSFFKDIPFEAEVLLLHKGSIQYELWMNIALPAKKLFMEKTTAYGPKNFSLHVWIEGKQRRGRAFSGQITIPFYIDDSFMNVIEASDFLCFHCKGPELTCSDRQYHAILAIFDPQTNEAGTWESTLSLPDFKENEQGSIINCVLGLITSGQKRGRESFSLSKKDGSLEYGEIKFFPAVTNIFQMKQDVSLFLQVHLPQGKIGIRPKFQISEEERLPQLISGKSIAESWNETSNVWSGIFNLDLKNLIFGDYTLKVEIPVSEKVPALSKEIKLIKLPY
ncbi:MAG: VWA domain-containing protein [Candidatus Aminicenantes bacterium]|nr:VWA domain-containing protein [Candidatus Aminicenantes bacterium]